MKKGRFGLLHIFKITDREELDAAITTERNCVLTFTEHQLHVFFGFTENKCSQRV